MLKFEKYNKNNPKDTFTCVLMCVTIEEQSLIEFRDAQKKNLKADFILEFSKCYIGKELGILSVTQRADQNWWNNVTQRQKCLINKADQQWNRPHFVKLFKQEQDDHLARKMWRIFKHLWKLGI